MTWKYLLCINENKHPEVCEALDKAKEKDGIALYIRKLVEQDLAQRSRYKPPMFSSPEVAATIEMPQLPRSFANHTEDEEDDFGGGLA